MKVGVKVKIDVTKIDKQRLFAGKKGTYLDATVFVDVDNKDQYDNNGMITQDVTKEEKDSGVKGPILGNVQVFWRDDNNNNRHANNQAMGRSEPAPQQQQQQYRQQAPQHSAPDNFNDDIPF